MPDTVLAIHRCASCATLDGSRVRRCRRCGGLELSPTPVAGTGRLVSWTVVRRPGGAFDGRPPFAVAMIDLDEGVRLTGQLETFEPEPDIGASVVFSGLDETGAPVFKVQ